MILEGKVDGKKAGLMLTVHEQCKQARGAAGPNCQCDLAHLTCTPVGHRGL